MKLRFIGKNWVCDYGSCVHACIMRGCVCVCLNGGEEWGESREKRSEG